MKSLSIPALRSQLKKICKHPAVVDVIIFGSTVKEKEKPADLDVAILFKDEDYKVIESIGKEIKELLPSGILLHYEPLMMTQLLHEPMLLTLLHEGFSVRRNAFISASLKTKSLVLVTYSLTHLIHSKKTLFGYALKGRTGKEGLMKKVDAVISGRNSLLVPTEHFEELVSFLKLWGVPFTRKRVLELKAPL
ncbi:nucleotidyltransferase domain-containing protein [Candidatus Woesearchaeota archaeon]|nr:nucleotidyltransferase domain-containing protein [Candidatus Woesearchaeota archaeon]